MRQVLHHMCFHLVLCLLAFSACSMNPNDTSNTAITITDSLEREIVLKALPERIIIAGKANFMINDAVYLFPQAPERIVALTQARQGTQQFISSLDANYEQKARFTLDSSAEEIAASYEQLEREFGRRGNELGELRKITDDILKAQLSPTKQAESEDGITSETLLDDPQAAIDRAIANSPEVKALRADKAETASNVALERLKTDHPDAGAVIASPDFNAWINAIPSRAARYATADNVQDFDVANELIATFKEVHPVSTPTPEQTAAADAARQAELDGVRGAKPGASNPGTKQKGKILLRADLMRLRQSDPDRYNRLGPQIEKAYAENRVR